MKFLRENPGRRLVRGSWEGQLFTVLLFFLFLLVIADLLLSWLIHSGINTPVIVLILLINLGLALLLVLFFRRFQRRVDEGAASFRSIFENSSDAIGVSIHGVHTALLNPAYLRLFGYASPNQLDGRPVLDLIDPDRREQMAALIRDRAAGLPCPTRYLTRGCRADQTCFDMEVKISIYFLDGRQHTLALLRDLTEQLRAEAEIQRLNQQLEQRIAERTAQLETTIQDLDAFTYSVSHDLRAPLRAISGFAEVLSEDLDQRLTPQEVDDLRLIQNGVQRMSQMIDGLLAFSRLGRQALQRCPVDCDALLRDVLDDYRAEIAARQVQVELSALPPCTGDPALLRHVWSNLIANALKFTRQRCPAVVTIGSQPGSAGHTVYFVRDNGAGFDMRYAAHLFGVFQRLHSTEEFEGNGVGLAIVDRILKRHGGRIWAEAEPDKGACFSFIVDEMTPEKAS